MQSNENHWKIFVLLYYILYDVLASKDEGTKENVSQQIRRHVPPKASGPPRVFKCCQKDLIFDFDEETCVDPRTKDWFRDIRSTKTVKSF